LEGNIMTHPLTLQRVTPYQQGAVALGSPAIDADGWIDDLYSAWFDDLVPAIAWTRVLEAETYVLVVEDPDAPTERPFIHWMIWNIPGVADGLPAGLSRVARPPELPGAVQGLNSGGGHGWHGTKPPEGDGVHHYHFQLFALSGRLDHLKPDADIETLVDALKGMTIACAEIVGLYERPDPLAAPPPLADARGGLDEDDVDHHAPHSPDGEVLQRPSRTTRLDQEG
jgi:Raf kinase inhibitor-like YbhB/YbcL family protein